MEKMKKPEEMLVELKDTIHEIAMGSRVPDKEQIRSIIDEYDSLCLLNDLHATNFLQERLYRYNCENFAFFSSLYLQKEGVLRRLAFFGNRELTKAIAPILKTSLQHDKLHLFPLTINKKNFTLYVLVQSLSQSVALLFCAISSSSFFSIATHELYTEGLVSVFSEHIFKPCDEESLLTKIIEAGESGKYLSCLLCNCNSITDIFSHYGSLKLLSINESLRHILKAFYPDAVLFDFSIGIFVLFFRDNDTRKKTMLSYNGVPVPARYKESLVDDFEDENDYIDFLTR